MRRRSTAIASFAFSRANYRLAIVPRRALSSPGVRHPSACRDHTADRAVTAVRPIPSGCREPSRVITDSGLDTQMAEPPGTRAWCFRLTCSSRHQTAPSDCTIATPLSRRTPVRELVLGLPSAATRDDIMRFRRSALVRHPIQRDCYARRPRASGILGHLARVRVDSSGGRREDWRGKRCSQHRC